VLVIGGSLVPDATPLKTAIDELEISDLILHFAPYFILAFLPAFFEPRRTVWAIALLLPLVGVALEFAQELVGRTFGIGDIVANTAGVLCGWCAGARAAPRHLCPPPSRPTRGPESPNGSTPTEAPGYFREHVIAGALTSRAVMPLALSRHYSERPPP
jgi:hypothetical protein